MASEYWDIVPAAVGGVIGALAGGIPAWLIAKSQLKETLKRDQEDRRKTEKSLAFQVAVKLIIITNNIVALRTHVQKCARAKRSAENSHMEEWQLLLPMVGFTDEHNVRFSGEETAVFYAAGETDFLMDLLLLAQRNAATTTSFIHYCQQRAALVDILPKPTRFVGERGEAMLTEQQVLETLPHTIPVNMIAREIAANLEEDLSLCRKVASQFGPIVQAYFNDDKFVSLGFPDDDKLEEFIRSPTP